MVSPHETDRRLMLDWARLADVEVMEAINLGTRGVEEARVARAAVAGLISA